jgi:actin-related protein
VIHQFKETVLHVSETAFKESDLKRRPVKNFEFPSGFNTVFSIDRFKLVEGMFQPGFHLTPVQGTIPQLMAASASQCDVEIQPLMHSNAVLTGANTLLPGFADRVYNELHRIAPGGRVKVQAAGGSNERKFGPWIGGSILSSLAAFHQLWISKSQYEEIGVGVEKKTH